MDNRPIGFFDSGVGGLTCMPALQKELPDERVVYFGDTARAPYGSKSPSTIERLSFQIADYLVSRDVKMIVIACNTITATCLDSLRRRWPKIPIVGIIDPISERIANEADEPVNVGVIGTRATVTSGVYASSIIKRNRKVRVFSTACPLFAGMIEEGFVEGEIVDLVVKHYLDDFIADNNIQRMVMGCTHYPLLKSTFAKLYPHVDLLNPSEEVINKVKQILTETDSLAQPNDQLYQCFASDRSKTFSHMVERVFEDMSLVTIGCKELES